MTAWSDYSENAILNHLLRNTEWTKLGTSIYVALFTSDPGDDGSGTEVSGDGYARVQVSAWDAAAARSVANSDVIAFPVASGGDWGTITHYAIFDAATGGNLICYVAAASSMSISDGEAFELAAGALVISCAGALSTYAANALLDSLFNDIQFSTPGLNVYLSLHTADPGLTGASEVSGNAYARVQETGWDAPASGATQNTAATSMGTPTPSNWGTVTHCGIWDAASSGNFLMGGGLDSNLATTADKEIEFEAGALDIIAA